MKKYIVIGNPINHSLSPKLHNHWIKKNNIDAVYEKKQIKESDINEIISEVRNGKINGVNVTVPFKKSVIKHVDKLSPEANESQSVNTIYMEDNKIVGQNTDIVGFESALEKTKYDVKKKIVFILGAGGVVPSIILALKKMNCGKIILSNRTMKKAEELKKIYNDIELIDWGKNPEFNMIINATSLGLGEKDEIRLDYASIGSNKFFYDVIYNPKETNFLKKAKEFNNQTENGKMMFIYQASHAFMLWHKIAPTIDEETIGLLD